MRKVSTVFVLFICVMASLVAQPIQYHPKQEIQKYVDYLSSVKTDPKDYILQLFDKYDIVILAEADHRETTQWDFIYDVVSDPRFVGKVGNMFTEYGSVYLQPQLDEFFNKDYDANAVLRMMRDFMPNPEGWDHNNFYNFLQKLHKLNQSLGEDTKIHLYFSDQPSAWDDFIASYSESPNRYQVFYLDDPHKGDLINPRDRIMAMRVYTKFQNTIIKQPRKKALVIMNTRHGFGYIKQIDDPQNHFAYIGQNVGGYLTQWMPNQVANVMMHFAPNTGSAHLIQDGKWDAAFLCANNQPIGFNFADANNPFGQDAFDYGQIPSSWGKYQDIFTGFVFYKPLKDQQFCTNIKGFYDDSEYIKRVVYDRVKGAYGKDADAQYEKLRAMWDDMKKNPGKYCGRAYDDDFLKSMFQWVEPNVKQ
jgi:hypothetical protein